MGKNTFRGSKGQTMTEAPTYQEVLAEVRAEKEQELNEDRELWEEADQEAYGEFKDEIAERAREIHAEFVAAELEEAEADLHEEALDRLRTLEAEAGETAEA